MDASLSVPASLMDDAGRRRYAMWWIVALALAARLAAVLVFGFGHPGTSNDAGAYHDIAANLVTRHEYVTNADPPHRLDLPNATRPPLTPWLLAAVYLVTGPNWRAGQLAMVFLGAAGCVMIALLGRKLFGDPVGLVAGTLSAVYPFFVFVSSMPLTENLAVVLYVAVVILILNFLERQRMVDALGAGVVLGLAALNKPTILAAVPLLGGWLLLTSRGGPRTAFPLTLVLLAGTLATLLPWTVRNYLVLGAVFPVTTQAGAALYMANGFHADFPISRLEDGATGWYDRPGSGIDVEGLSPVEADRIRSAAAWRFIREHPAKFLEQSGRKMRVFWGAYPHFLHRASWRVVALLSLAGVYLTRRSWHRLMPVYLLIAQTALVHALFTALPRYRMSIEPFLLVFAAYALVWLAARFSLARPSPV